jgi:flagellar biosynthesis/type III secretory pathway protein FliH
MGWLEQIFLEEAKAEARAEGKAEGKAEGRAEGEAKTLIRILQSRFGGMPDSVQQRIFAAKVSEIDSWVDRVCHAPDLQSVFDTN